MYFRLTNDELYITYDPSCHGNKEPMRRGQKLIALSVCMEGGSLRYTQTQSASQPLCLAACSTLRVCVCMLTLVISLPNGVAKAVYCIWGNLKLALFDNYI